MSNKIKLVNNIKSIVGFNVNPSGDGFRTLPKQGTFIYVTEDELNYIHINQSIIQKGILWIDNQDMRIKLGLEDESGDRHNKNILQYEDIVNLVKGHHMTLASALRNIDEQAILLQFVEVARDLKIDSMAKVKMIEEKSKVKVFDDED